MNYQVFAPTDCSATIVLPTSKSISNRALILNALCRDAIPVENLSECDDTRVMRQAFAGSGPVVDIHGAGTAMRFLTAYYAQRPGSRITLTGSARMQQRPIRILVDALRSLGADIRYTAREGFPPLEICGRELKGGELTLPGDVSSQYISALLMIAPRMHYGLTLTLTGEMVSIPYIEMTLGMMARFGIEAGARETPYGYRPANTAPPRSGSNPTGRQPPTGTRLRHWPRRAPSRCQVSRPKVCKAMPALPPCSNRWVSIPCFLQTEQN